MVIVLHREFSAGTIGITLAGGADYESKEITVNFISIYMTNKYKFWFCLYQKYRVSQKNASQQDVLPLALAFGIFCPIGQNDDNFLL